MDDGIKLGVSTCLLGEKVRWDGGHKLDRFLRDTLGQHVDFVPVCPEMECGFGKPREPFRLEGDPEAPRLLTTHSRKDFTGRMVKWAKKRVVALEKEDLCGFIFKGNSPSCGMERVRVYNEKGMPVKKGRGIFAGIFMDHFPLIPVEDEGRLHDPGLRENFIERIFALKQWRDLLGKKWHLGNLLAFHAQNRLFILSHGEKHYRKMGRLVAEGKKVPIKRLYSEYETLLMASLKLKTTPKKNAHVLRPMMGVFNQQLLGEEKQELFEIIHQYREGK